jgi:hypothetical protein
MRPTNEVITKITTTDIAELIFRPESDNVKMAEIGAQAMNKSIMFQ